MRFRTVTIVAALAAILATPTLAFGWGNGTRGPDAYGTHDWVLDQAVRIAGAQGSWVDLSVALTATDDPDTLHTDTRLHVFREKGTGRGAAQTVADLYARCVASYRAGDRVAASRGIGLLSHYFSDVDQPFHAAYDGLRYHTALAPYGDLHVLYEATVDREATSALAHPGWAVARAPQRLTDVRAKTIAGARYARTLWKPLKAAMLADGGVSATDSVVASVTCLALRRACNDLADIVRAVTTGAGLARSPARVSVRVTPSSPAPTSSVAAYATCRDATGHGIEGVRVDFSWPTSSAVRVATSAYTDHRGVAVSWHRLDGVAAFRKVTLRCAAPTFGQPTRTGSASFTATPRLASGTAGFKCSAGPSRPKRNTRVTATARVRGADGVPAAGLTVRFSWRYRTKTVTVYAKTGVDGIARSVRDIGAATRGRRVSVIARVVSGGATRTSTAYFTPR